MCVDPRGHDCGFPPVSSSAPILADHDRASTLRLLPTGSALLDSSGVNALRPTLPSAPTTATALESSSAPVPAMSPGASACHADPHGQSSSATTPGSSMVAPPVPVSGPPRTHLQDGIHKPKIYSDGTVCYAYSTTSGEPYTV